jgi:hypothetical protein
MTILVVQSTAGTTALNGTAPDPTNVPGNNWAADVNTARLAGGGVGIPVGAFDGRGAAYNLGTARQKIVATGVGVLDTTTLVRALINKDASASTPYGSGTGYALVIQANNAISVQSWSGAGAPSVLATSASTIPNSVPLTITSLVFEHLTSGTLNASVVIGGTTYSATAAVGSPLSGQWLGFFNTSGASGGVNFSAIQFENEVTVTYTYARPTSDITTQWSPSTGTAHYALIDETVASDADYIFATAGGQTDEVKLAAMTAPKSGTSVDVQYRVTSISGGGKVTLSLVCGTTVIATDAIRQADGDYTLTVAPATWAAVTDWSDMRLRFVSSI